MSATIPPPANLGARYSSSQIRFGAAAAHQTGGFSYALLLGFFAMLYSNIALLVPAVEVVRPAQTLGGLALIFLLLEKVAARESFDLVWPDTYLLFAFIGAAALSIFGAFWQGYAVEATLNLLKMAVIYLLIVNAVNSEKRLRGLFWVMVLCGLFPALGTLWNWYSGVLYDGRASWIGIFANANEMAYALVLLIPLAAGLAAGQPLLRRIPLYAIVALYIPAIYLSFSRGSLIGLFAVVAYLAWRQPGKITRVALMAVLIAGILAVPLYWSRGEGFTGLGSDASFQQRLDTYKVALRMFADHPVLGVGIHCSSVAWPMYAPSGLNYNTWLITHNTFLEALSETGIVGFVPFVLFTGAVLYRAWRTGRSPRPGREEAARLVSFLEISMWGFVVCGLSGGYVMSWFPYLLAGLIGAGGKLAEQHAD